MNAPVIPRDRWMFPGGGEIARLMGKYNWAATDLGAADQWPENLQVIVSVCLTSELPACIWWGLDRVMVHNDRFVPFLNERVPSYVLGNPGRRALPELWEAVGPLIDCVCNSGKACVTDDIPVPFASETGTRVSNVRLSITPVFSRDCSRVDGVFCLVINETPGAPAARPMEPSLESGAILRESERQIAFNLSGMTRLQALSAWLVKTGDLHSLLNEILAASTELAGTDKGTIDLYDPPTERLEIAVRQGLGSLFIRRFDPGQCAATSRALHECCRIIIQDVRDDPALQGTAERELFLGDDIRAVQCMPLISRDGRRLGLLNNFFRAPHRPAEHELRLLDLLARMAADCIERSQAERALRHGEEKLRRAMDIETVGIIFFNTSGSIADANDAFLRMSGHSREELELGQLRWDTMTPPEWIPHSLNAVAEFKALGRTIPYEKQFTRKDRSRWWALCSATRLEGDEGVEFIIDITERKAGDEELRRHRDDLEIRVQERTAALDAANGALRDEIVERQRAEASRQELLRQLASAQEEERRRISRELHDEVGQHITALMLGLKSFEHACTEPPNPATLASLQAITEKVGKEIHDLALELRPTALDDLGLLRTLANYIEQWSSTSKIEVDFHSAGWTGERLPPPIETTAYRIVQEALTNVVKHAAATRVSLIIERRPEQVTLIIEDDGNGFDVDALPPYPRTKRLGLLGMVERAALMDGEVKVESGPQKGTTVFVRIPLPAPQTATLDG